MPARKNRRSEETALSAAIQQALTAKGCRVVRVQSGVLPVLKGGKTAFVHCAKKGTPDLVVMRPATSVTPIGRHTWLEVKSKVGETNADQIEWHTWAALNGFRVATVRGVQEAIDAVFKAII